MNLFIYTGASRLNAAVVESATDLTPVSRLPDLIVGDSEPVTVKFLSASGAYESWSGGGTYTLSISIGALGADGVGAYFQTSSFTTVTNGWTGRIDLAASALRSAVGGYLADRPGVTGAPLTLQVRVTDASGNTETYARQSVVISGAVSVPTTADSTPVTYATAADVAADAATASAAAIAAAASASAASGSASTAAGHVTTAGNSATAAAASATTAGNSATTASGHATTATTQATNAATSASSASTYKDAAAVSAASATSSAGTATTQAALATTNGAAQVTLATTQATNAGTSASAAAVSAAAALVSEAAALVSKNAAAASAATASAVSGSGNGTFSAAALTGVNSVTASASTALTLTGGSTGASLVLGQGAGKAVFNRAITTSSDLQFDSAGGYLFADSGGSLTGLFLSRTNNVVDFFTANTQRARLTTTGNLLIGTTTDAASLAGGLVINGSGAGAAASSTTTGALRVTGGVGVSGAGYFGGTLSVTGVAAVGTSTDASTALDVRGALTGASQYGIAAQPVFSSGATSSGSTSYFQMRTAVAAYTMAIGTVIEIPVPAIGATSAVTTLKGISIANQGAAGVTNAYGIDIAAQSGAATTNIGLRNAGITSLTNSTPSTGVGSGALQVAGGIAVSKQSWFEDTSPGTNVATFYTNNNTGIATGHVYINSNQVAAPFDSLRVRQAGTGNILSLVGTAAAGTVMTVASSGDVKIGTSAAPTYGTAGKLYVYGGPIRANLNGTDSTWVKAMTYTPTGDNFRHVHQYAWSNTGNSVATKWVKEINGTETDMMSLTDGNLSVVGAVTIAGTVIHTLSATPASASATGTVGTMSWDANYIYICTATNTWKRVAIATW